MLIEKVWQVWNCSKSWCIPNYQISVFSKTRHFLLPDFRRIWERVSELGILGLIAWVGNSSKSWCIPNYQISVYFKNSSFFCCLIFEEFEKEFLNQGFYGQIPEQAWSNGFFDFSKIVPLGAPRLFIQMVLRWKWVFVRITNNDHQFFRESYYQNLETFFFTLALRLWHLFPFLEMSTKFVMTKSIQNKFIHFMQMLTLKQNLHFSRSAFTNENIHNKNCP